MYYLQNLVLLDWFCRSFIYTKNNSGPNTESCGTSTSIPSQSDSYPPKLTNSFLSE